MLNIDRCLRNTLSEEEVENPMTLWDVTFLRHQKEREQVLEWDDSRLQEQKRLLFRSSSMETIHAVHPSEPEESVSDGSGRLRDTAMHSSSDEMSSEEDNNWVPSSPPISFTQNMTPQSYASAMFSPGARNTQAGPSNLPSRSFWIDADSSSESSDDSDSESADMSSGFRSASSSTWDHLSESDSDAESFVHIQSDSDVGLDG